MKACVVNRPQPEMPRAFPWKPTAIVSTLLAILLSLLLLPACCCVQRLGPHPTGAPVTRIPQIGTEDIPTPTEAQAKGPTQAEMHNVHFHFDEVGYLDIQSLRGEMQDRKGGLLNFDDKLTFVMRVDTARIGMDGASLDRLMNHYVFNYENPPLRNLHISFDGKQLKQEGIIHKIVDIPFTMWADVSASEGKIRIHPTRIDICGINGLGLLKAVGQSLEKLIGKELPHAKGVTAEKNDLVMDPAKMLPPPEVELRLVGVQIEGAELVQRFDAGRHAPPLHPPHPEEKNWMYYRGGTLRMGKLLMVDADMEVTDTDPSDPFDFFIDRYNDQLVAGFSRNQPNYGLFVFMRDFDDLGTPLKPEERHASE
jgi:hypothetical protein